MCADLNSARLRAMQECFRGVRGTSDYRDVLRNPQIDAVVVATPTASHYRLVKESLLSGKDVLCEKPLCLNPEEAQELISVAKKRRRILMVGHVFLYNAGIRMLKDLLDRRQCGRVYYLHSERTNLGPFRSDVNAVWDLASHDVAVFNYLLGGMPLEVSARGGKYLQKQLEDVAFVSMVYPRGVLVNIHVSWLDPRKVRQITLVADKQMVIWDDLDMVGPIKIYNRRVVKESFYETFGEFHLLAKEGDITIPKVELCEPLKKQALHFLECIHSRCRPLTDGTESFRGIQVLSAIQKSLSRKGSPVSVG